jgi:hypothetical protein
MYDNHGDGFGAIKIEIGKKILSKPKNLQEAYPEILHGQFPFFINLS